MTIETLEREVRALPPNELAGFVQWLDDYLGRVALREPRTADELSDQEKQELLRRRDQILADASTAEPMDDTYFERLKKELADARRSGAS